MFVFNEWVETIRLPNADPKAIPPLKNAIYKALVTSIREMLYPIIQFIKETETPPYATPQSAMIK